VSFEAKANEAGSASEAYAETVLRDDSASGSGGGSRAIEGDSSVMHARGQRLGKCFRDEDELAASSSLPESITNALSKSRCLIVICSEDTAESQWVHCEI